MRICSLSLILILSACGPSPETNAQDDRNVSAESAPPGASTPDESNKPSDPFVLRAGAWSTDFGDIVPNPNVPADVVAKMNAGMPSGFDYCLPADTKSPDAEFLSGSPNQGCTYESVSFEGGRIQGAMRCDSPDLKVRYEFAGTYDAESYEILSNATLSEGEWQTTATMSQRGRRVGDC